MPSPTKPKLSALELPPFSAFRPSPPGIHNCSNAHLLNYKGQCADAQRLRSEATYRRRCGPRSFGTTSGADAEARSLGCVCCITCCIIRRVSTVLARQHQQRCRIGHCSNPSHVYMSSSPKTDGLTGESLSRALRPADLVRCQGFHMPSTEFTTDARSVYRSFSAVWRSRACG